MTISCDDSLLTRGLAVRTCSDNMDATCGAVYSAIEELELGLLPTGGEEVGNAAITSARVGPSSYLWKNISTSDGMGDPNSSRNKRMSSRKLCLPPV